MKLKLSLISDKKRSLINLEFSENDSEVIVDFLKKEFSSKYLENSDIKEFVDHYENIHYG